MFELVISVGMRLLLRITETVQSDYLDKYYIICIMNLNKKYKNISHSYEDTSYENC